MKILRNFGSHQPRSQGLLGHGQEDPGNEVGLTLLSHRIGNSTRSLTFVGIFDVFVRSTTGVFDRYKVPVVLARMAKDGVSFDLLTPIYAILTSTTGGFDK